MQYPMLLIFFQVSSATHLAAASQLPCSDIPASIVVEHLMDLTPDIRKDLLRTYKDMGDHDSAFLETDSPTAEEEFYPKSRFVQAVLIKNVWYVQFEVSMFAGVRTMSYVRTTDGHFHRSRSGYLGGPVCKTLRAIMDGVYNPGDPYL